MQGFIRMSDLQLSLEICRPIEAHARLVIAWRNDPHTLEMFYHHEPKVWDKFYLEFRDDYFVDPNLPPMFVRQEGELVAFLRYQQAQHPAGENGRTVDVSINVAPDARGRGIGAAALRLGSNYLRSSAGVDCVVAEVRQENAGSCRAFAAAGYSELGKAEKVIADTGEICKIVRFVQDLTPRYWRARGVKVIAEAGSNWRVGTLAGDRAMARTLIDVAVEAGADAVKFQTYRPDTVYAENAGKKVSIRDIFTDLAMPYEMVEELATYCIDKNIAFMCTPFSLEDFVAIDPFVKAHKIASYEISHPHLLRLAGNSGKPLVLSTGVSTETDIAWAVETFQAAGGSELCLLQSTAAHPTPLSEMNLRAIPWLKARFGVASGLSDHSRDPLLAPLTAVGLGATVIEKHFTLDNKLPGPDHSFAITAYELRLMVDGIREAEKSLGDGVVSVLPVEGELSSFARCGVQATRAISIGEVFHEDSNIAVLRPGNQRLGVHPRNLDNVVGRRASRNIASGEGVLPDDWEV